MEEYWTTPEEVKDIIEAHNLIDQAIEEIKTYYSREGFDEYDVAKIVFDDIDDRMSPLADKIWWTEDCNKMLFRLVREKMAGSVS